MQQDLTDRINQEVSEYNRAWLARRAAERPAEQAMKKSRPKTPEYGEHAGSNTGRRRT